MKTFLQDKRRQHTPVAGHYPNPRCAITRFLVHLGIDFSVLAYHEVLTVRSFTSSVSGANYCDLREIFCSERLLVAYSESAEF